MYRPLLGFCPHLMSYDSPSYLLIALLLDTTITITTIFTLQVKFHLFSKIMNLLNSEKMKKIVLILNHPYAGSSCGLSL